MGVSQGERTCGSYLRLKTADSKSEGLTAKPGVTYGGSGRSQVEQRLCEVVCEGRG